MARVLPMIWILTATVSCVEYSPRGQGTLADGPNVAVVTVQASVFDRFVQETLPEVDVLYLVDNSASMSEEQQLLADNFPLFLDVLDQANVDYHVGVISTDMGDSAHQGKLRQYSGRRFIDAETESPGLAFGSMAVLGAEGSGDERGRDAIYQALTEHRDGYNAGFYRDSAALVLIAISDEDDHSYSVSLAEFSSWGASLKAQPDWFRFSSIVSSAPLCDTASEVGSNYLALSSEFPGTTASICADRWDSLMVDLGLNTAGLRSEFFLSQIPQIDTLSVQVVDGPVVMAFESTDWVYSASRNSVTFHDFLPEAGAVVEIRYES